MGGYRNHWIQWYWKERRRFTDAISPVSYINLARSKITLMQGKRKCILTDLFFIIWELLENYSSRLLILSEKKEAVKDEMKLVAP